MLPRVKAERTAALTEAACAFVRVEKTGAWRTLRGGALSRAWRAAHLALLVLEEDRPTETSRAAAVDPGTCAGSVRRSAYEETSASPPAALLRPYIIALRAHPPIALKRHSAAPRSRLPTSRKSTFSA